MPRGGGFNILRGWIRHLPPDRYDLALAYFSPERAMVEAALAPWPHVRLVHVDALRSAGALYIPAISALWRLLAVERPDVLHSVMVQSDILGAIAARGAGVPVVISSAIGYLVPSQTTPWKAAVYRLGLRIARRWIDRVLAISGATKRELVQEFGFAPDRVQVVYSGIDLGDPPALRRGPRADGPVIGTVGELILKKGVQHVLRAAPAILAAVPNARFRIVGDGGYRKVLEALAVSLGIRDRVEFSGWAADGRGAIADFDVFVFPSDPGYDGLPRVLLEAWAVGTPVVTSNVAVVPEIVRAGIDGVVVPPGDPAAIAAAVRQLLSDPDRWRRMRDAGLERAPEFSVEREVQVLRHIYGSMLQRAGAVRRG